MAETRVESVSFSVEGAFIMDFARQRYWFEDAQESAMRVLGTLQGMTVDQALKVLYGDAILSGIDGRNSTIKYEEVEDKEFKKEIAARKKYWADKAAAEAAEKEKEREKLERHIQLDEEREERRAFYMQPLPKMDNIFVEESAVKVGLGGKYMVKESILKKYIQVYVAHHFMVPGDPYRVIMENQFLMELHKRLRGEAGLKGYWGRGAGNEPDEFDAALQKVCWEAVEKDPRYGQEMRLERAGIKPTEKTFGGDEPKID